MKTTTFTTLFGIIATVAAYPATNGLWPRSCTPGTLVCSGKTKFGLCNIDNKAVFMAVAAGTECICSGSDCKIAAASSGSSNSGKPAVSPKPVAPIPSKPAAPISSVPSTKPAAPSKPAPTVDSGAAKKKINPALANDSGALKPGSEPIPDAPSSPPAAAPSTIAATPSPPPKAADPKTPTAPIVTPVAIKHAEEPSAAPSASSSDSGSDSGPPSVAGKTYIKTFLGNGDSSSGWPGKSLWADFDSMWSSDLAIISKSCAGFGQDNNSDEESADLKSAIQSVASSSGVDERFILAIVMQESGGCVRAPTTNYGVVNPGLMQSHDGAHSCYNVSPCPSSQIIGMIQDGTEGTSSGPGLKQDLAAAGVSDDSQYYKAARIYNSGSVASSGLLQDGIATHCYASDIANRLIGWSEGVGACSM